MCGISGFLAASSWGEGEQHWLQVLRQMSDRIQHRGPDDVGAWVDTQGGVGLAHRRLSIVDLSPAGHQPMVSSSGRYVIVFNGEIYNHRTLRQQLDLHEPGRAGPAGTGAARWRGHSDTETLLAGFEAWGVQRTLERTVGMFALGLWDRHDASLVLARDRLGEKPLYYGWQGGSFLFASELKALKGHPDFRGEIDRRAVDQQLRYSCVPAPLSIYAGILKLPPGTLLRIRGGSGATERPAPQAYWSFEAVVQAGQAASVPLDEPAALDRLESLLRDAVGLQMVADVPLGAFLSGGVDSSTVVALMQAQSGRRVRTFTIGFEETGFDEAGDARAVARHLGTEHTELYVTPASAMEVIPRLCTIYDEPFSDMSQIPTYLLSRMASAHVTVSLSGDGGDELFGGYNRYLGAHQWWPRLSALPAWSRRAAASALMGVAPRRWDALSRLAAAGSGGRLRPDSLGDKAQKLAAVLRAADGAALHQELLSHWRAREALVLGVDEPSPAERPPSVVRGIVSAMMARDTLGYLPDDILVKVDRAAMANSLETRVPLLDHRVVEFAWSLPLHMKIRGGQGKWALRQVLYRHVPRDLIERPKKGFGVPMADWLRGPLRDWAESLLDEARLAREGFLRPAPIRRRWAEHLSGRRNWQAQLWGVLMFQAWLEHERVA